MTYKTMRNWKNKISAFRDKFKQYSELCMDIYTYRSNYTKIPQEKLAEEKNLREELTEKWGELEPLFRRLPYTLLKTYRPATGMIESIFDEALSSDFNSPRKGDGLSGSLQSLNKAVGIVKNYEEDDLDKMVTPTKNLFISYNFHPTNKEFVDTIKDIVSSFRVAILLGSEPGVESISEKVKRKIEQSDIVLIIMTTDERKANGTWIASEWVKQEAVYALGLNKVIIRLIEEGVDKEGRIFGDREYISFVRDNLTPAIVKLTKILNNLL